MSLTVELAGADSTFRLRVQTTLRQMCPCQSVRVDLVTGKVTTGAMSCACYCDHPAGCNLLTDLVRDPRSITIWFSESSSGYFPDTNEIWWYTKDVDFSDPDVCGNTLMPASTQLVHELVHARHENFTEDETVRGENQVRREWCMPMRTAYGDPVDDFRVGTIDASIRAEYNCTCGFWRGGFWATIFRWLCALRSMYCFPFPGSWVSYLFQHRGPND